MERIGDFVAVREVEPVVTLTAVRETPRFEALPETLIPLVNDFLVVEGANAAAFYGLLSSLPDGGAFLISGVYGTGKSHLLAVIGLLAEFPDARHLFLRRNPDWKPFFRPLSDRRWFVIYVTLDEYDPTAWALEEIVAREVEAEAKRKGFSVPDDPSARGEWLRGIWEGAQRKGFSGLVFLIDELAMFLNAKEGKGLNRDASFLQFLAQGTQRMPLLFVGALQRGIEDIHPLEPYAWRQVRDRFRQTWVLSFAHALPLLNAVLLEKPREAELSRCLSALCHQKGWTLSTELLWACYPFHPHTLRCLERSVGAFFSRTRSLVTFVQTVVSRHLDDPWYALIGPYAIIDHFYPDLLAHPQLRPFAQTVLPYLEQWGSERGEGETVTRLAKTILAFQVGGQEASAKEVAEALGMDAETVWGKMEAMRGEANYVEGVRRTGSPLDTYRLNPEITTTEVLRRRVMEQVQGLGEDDPRLLHFAWDCRDEEWFPPAPREPRTIGVRWQQTRRKIVVTVMDLRQVTEAQLRQSVMELANPMTEESLALFIATPFSVPEQKHHFLSLLKQMGKEERFIDAIVAWLPRPPTEAEMRRWKENTAFWLLEKDQSLAESEWGMRVLERVKDGIALRRWETRRLMQRLYRDGRVLGKEGERPLGQDLGEPFPTFDTLLNRIAESILPHVFPRFPEIAPGREASGQTYHALARLLLRGLPSSILDINAKRWLEAVVCPLGVLSPRDEGWEVTTPPADLLDNLLSAIGDRASYREVEGRLAKSPFGLTPELTELVIAASLHTGVVMAYDRGGNSLAPETLPTPLSRSVARLAPAKVLSQAQWKELRPYLLVLIGETVPEVLTPEGQQKLWERLKQRGQEWRLMMQDVGARLTQWQRSLGQGERQWASVRECLHLLGEVVEHLTAPFSSLDGLKGLKEWFSRQSLTPEKLWDYLNAFMAAAAFFASSAELLKAWGYLTAIPRLPDALEQKRASLLEGLQEGEAILSGWREWLETYRSFRDDYATAYLRHHDREHGKEAFSKLRGWRQREAGQILAALSSIPGSPGEGKEVLRKIEGVLERQCPEKALSLRPRLEQTPLCPRCGLALGETVAVDAEALIKEGEEALKKMQEWFAKKAGERLAPIFDTLSVSERSKLQRLLSLTPGSDLGAWREVLPVLPTLQRAFSPQGIVEVNLEEVCQLLEGRFLTLGEALQVFRDWLTSKVPSPQATHIRFRRR